MIAVCRNRKPRKALVGSQVFSGLVLGPAECKQRARSRCHGLEVQCVAYCIEVGEEKCPERLVSD